MAVALNFPIGTSDVHGVARPRLLVSVRDADEARVAVTSGADIIDAKDPLRGPLGAVGEDTLRAIVAVGNSCAVSAAIGDIGDEALAEARAAAHAGVTFVKVGSERVDNAATLVAWLRHAMEVTDQASAATRACKLVVAAYADRPAARDADQFVDLAARGGAAGILLDTRDKDGRSLFDVMAPETVARWVELGHSAALTVAVAGGLKILDVAIARSLGADVIGVRGAACRGGRTGRISAACVEELRHVTDDR